MSKNPYWNDAFKSLFDVNQLAAIQRRNLEALAAANQVIVEGAQEIVRRQTEVIRGQVEQVMSTSRDMFNTTSPETNIERQSELTKTIFENAMTNLREITEMATKSSFEAYDLLNKRAAENMEELSRASAGTGFAQKKKAA